MTETISTANRNSNVDEEIESDQRFTKLFTNPNYSIDPTYKDSKKVSKRLIKRQIGMRKKYKSK